jgi:hypothetical protein
MGVANAPGNADGSRGISVRNGTVMGMGPPGVYLISAGGAVDNMTVISKGRDGILVEFGTATGNGILKNGANGIDGGNAVITGNMVTGNRSYGIVVNDSLVLTTTR